MNFSVFFSEMEKKDLQKENEYLQQRITHLESINRLTLDAMDLAMSLGNFDKPISSFGAPDDILREASRRARRLFNFHTISFYFVSEDDADFHLFFCDPESNTPYIEQQKDHLIEKGSFAWALRKGNPLIAFDQNKERQLILQSMVASSRVRGLCIGALKEDVIDIPDVTLSLFAIILRSTSGLIESFELYKLIHTINKELEDKARNLEEVNTALKILLERRDATIQEIEEKMLLNIRELVVPYLERVMRTQLSRQQKNHLAVCRANLDNIVSPFLQRLSTKYMNLTHTEIKVAEMIKEGRTNKEIADIMGLSKRTIDTHRENIRKKLGIINKKANLKTHLLSLQ